MKIKYFLFALLAIITMASCSDKDSEGLTRITYYPTIELSGDTYIVMQKGTDYEEPGYSSFMNGEDVTDKVTVTTDLNTSKSGIYTITYTTMTNEDGYGSSASRTVVVLDLNDPVEGFYLTSADSYRDYNGAQVAFGAEYETLVIGNGDGSYYFEDLLGGWYSLRAGYGSSYALTGNVAFAEDGTMSVLNSYLAGWASYGYALEAFSGTYDYSSSSLSMVVTYVGMDFHITMTKE